MPDQEAALQIALVQQASALDPEVNRTALRETARMAVQDGRIDLLVFPEAYCRDFGPPGSDISAYAEGIDGPFVQEMTAVAAEHETTVVAGMFERSDDPDRPYNTLAVVDGNGLRGRYRKIHLYDSFGHKESDRLSAGDIEPVSVDLRGLRVGLMTCYDLRFPELARALVAQDSDLLVVPAAWVSGPGKVDHWRTLVKARAIENTAYVAAAGQPGPRYTGHSMVVSPTGQVLTELEDEGDLVARATVESRVVVEARERNPSLANRRF